VGIAVGLGVDVAVGEDSRVAVFEGAMGREVVGVGVAVQEADSARDGNRDVPAGLGGICALGAAQPARLRMSASRNNLDEFIAVSINILLT
jgi:hypothetical protein